MQQLLTQLAPQAALFMLIATRLSAMLVVAPVFSSRMIPARVKAGLVIILSYVTLPVVAAEGGVMPGGVVGFAALAVKEALIGFAFGLIAQFLFAAIQTAGALLDVTAGFAIAQALDPTTNTSTSILGRWYNMVAVASFLALGGHQMLVAGVVRSFALAPPLAHPDMHAVVVGVLYRPADILLIVVEIAAPILGALLITDVTLGVISRSVPQMNVFVVGLPLKIIVALGGSAILLPAMIQMMNGLFGQMFSDMSQIMRAAGGG